jgi:large subunit ribosomal protein L10
MSRLEEKKLVVDELKKVADEALSAVVVDYRGTNVPDLTLLRKDASSSSVYLRVIKNTLAKRALEGTKFDSINEILTGPSLFAFSLDDFQSAAKLVKDFSKSHESFSVKGLSVGEGLLDASELDRLASLPTKEEAISMLMSVLQSPIQKFAGGLHNLPSNFVRTLDAVKETKS